VKEDDGKQVYLLPVDAKIEELDKTAYPLQELYDNLGKDESLALAIDRAVRASRQDDWRSNAFKVKRVRNAIKAELESGGKRVDDGDGSAPGIVHKPEPAGYGEASKSLEQQIEAVLALVKNHDEY